MSQWAKVALSFATAAAIILSSPVPALANAPLAPGEIVITEFFEDLWRIDPATGGKSVLNSGTFDPRDIIAIDANRHVLAIDNDDQLVRFNPTTLAVTPLTTSSFPSAKDIALEPSGNVLVVADDNIFRVNPTSGVTTTLVDRENVNDGFFGPAGIAVGATGRIFVTEFFEQLWEINPATGAAAVLPRSREVELATFIDVRSDGDLIVRDFNLGDLLKINPNTGLVTTFATGLPTFTADLEIEEDNDIVIASTDGVFRYDASTGAETPLAIDGPLFSPQAIAVAPGAAPQFASADFNRDGLVNGADLTVWRAGFGRTTASTYMHGNADGDADVDGADFLLWQRQLGTTASATAAVPEPSTACLACLAAVNLRMRIRNRGRGKE